MSVQLLPLRGIPLIRAGTDVASIIIESLKFSDIALQDQDIVVIAQKIVSKAEHRSVLLAEITPSPKARELALKTDKDPRLVELILQESIGIVRQKRGVLITRHRLGFVVANAGIDQSNIDHSEGEQALLLPRDPDRSASRIRQKIAACTKSDIAVIICDSVNRPWRLGSVGMAIGVAHTAVLDDRRGTPDLYGRELHVTVSNRADSIATAALLVLGETDEKVPVAVVRGLPKLSEEDGAYRAIRPLEDDLFQ